MQWLRCQLCMKWLTEVTASLLWEISLGKDKPKPRWTGQIILFRLSLNSAAAFLNACAASNNTRLFFTIIPDYLNANTPFGSLQTRRQVKCKTGNSPATPIIAQAYLPYYRPPWFSSIIALFFRQALQRNAYQWPQQVERLTHRPFSAYLLGKRIAISRIQPDFQQQLANFTSVRAKWEGASRGIQTITPDWALCCPTVMGL